MGWPKKVPILTASDMHHGNATGPNGSHCLVGWCHTVFSRTGSDAEVYEALRTEAGIHSGLVRWNDSHTKRQCAAVWNRAMKRLGYTEACNR